MPRTSACGVSQRQAQTSKRATKNSHTRSLHASPGNRHRCPGVSLCRRTSLPRTAGWLWAFSGWHCHGGPCRVPERQGTAWRGTVQQHPGSPSPARLLPGAAVEARRALAGGSGGLRCRAPGPAAPGGKPGPKWPSGREPSPLGEQHDVTSWRVFSRGGGGGKPHPRGKGARCISAAVALVSCPAPGRQLGERGLMGGAARGAGATLGAAGPATNSCRRPARRRGIATAAGGGTRSSGSCEKASGAAGRGGGGGRGRAEAAGAAKRPGVRGAGSAAAGRVQPLLRRPDLCAGARSPRGNPQPLPSTKEVWA